MIRFWLVLLFFLIFCSKVFSQEGASEVQVKEAHVKKGQVKENEVKGAKPSKTNQVKGARPSKTNQVEGAKPSKTNQVEGARPSKTNQVEGAKPSKTNQVALPDGTGDKDSVKSLRLRLEAEILSYLSPYVYEPGERRSLFKKDVQTVVEKETKNLSAEVESKAGPALSLESYEVDQISLVGIMWDVKTPKALFRDPNKKVWPAVGVGSRFHNGYVAAIREGEVVVMQTERDVEGKGKLKAKIMRVNLEVGGGKE